MAGKRWTQRQHGQAGVVTINITRAGSKRMEMVAYNGGSLSENVIIYFSDGVTSYPMETTAVASGGCYQKAWGDGTGNPFPELMAMTLAGNNPNPLWSYEILMLGD